MKKLKLVNVIIVAELEDDLEDNQIVFEDDINITSGVLSGKVIDNQYIFNASFFKEEINYHYAKDIIEKINVNKKRKKVSTIIPKSRPATKEEIKLIEEFNKCEPEEDEYLCYDLNENHTLVYTNTIYVNFYDDGYADVERLQISYSIKHGIVFFYNENTFIDDLDEDISEITDLL